LLPLAAPQTPLTASSTLQETVVLVPAQLHVVVVPLSASPPGVPGEQVLAVAPHTGLTGSDERHEAGLPPLLPEQTHVVVAPLLVAGPAEPEEQVSTAAPQAPLTTADVLA
jgi:hypothetical protein